MVIRMVEVAVVYAGISNQASITLQVPEGTTIATAIQQSGILLQFPEIDLSKNKVGIFSKGVTLEAILQNGDRVEIYRPLLIDPKQARKQRAQRQGRRR